MNPPTSRFQIFFSLDGVRPCARLRKRKSRSSFFITCPEHSVKESLMIFGCFFVHRLFWIAPPWSSKLTVVDTCWHTPRCWGKQKAAKPIARRHALSQRQLAYYFDGILGGDVPPPEAEARWPGIKGVWQRLKSPLRADFGFWSKTTTYCT